MGSGPGQVNAASPSPYAVEVVAVRGPFGPALYDDPLAVLGPPATDFHDPMGAWSGGSPARRVKLVEPAYHLDPTQTRKLLLTLGEGAEVVVRLDPPVRDDPAHPFGVDFLVFGNAAFTAAGSVTDATDLNTLPLTGGGFFEPLRVAVSPGPTGAPDEDPTDPVTWRWYEYERGPFADTLFPTQAYQWDRARAAWTDQLMDFTKPVNPALAEWFEAGAARPLTAAEAIALYDGAGGGTGFDLRESEFAAIGYVKIAGRPGQAGGEVDAVAAVRPLRLGDSLLVVPDNLAAGPFEQTMLPLDASEAPALTLTVHAVEGPLRFVLAALAVDELPLAGLGEVLNAVALEVHALRAGDPTGFVADLALATGPAEAGEGRDLAVWRREGAGWSPAPFRYAASAGVVWLTGLKASAKVVVMHLAPPRLEGIEEDGRWAVRFTPRPGWRHTLEGSADLRHWDPVAQLTPAGPAPVVLTDPAEPPSHRFYRLRLELP